MRYIKAQSAKRGAYEPIDVEHCRAAVIALTYFIVISPRHATCYAIFVICFHALITTRYCHILPPLLQLPPMMLLLAARVTLIFCRRRYLSRMRARASSWRQARYAALRRQIAPARCYARRMRYAREQRAGRRRSAMPAVI